MKLIVGITKLLPEWKIIIQQIGISYEVVSLEKSIPSDQFSVIVVTKKETDSEKDVLLHYISAGGSILTEADVAEWLFNIDTVSAFISTIETDDDPIYNGIFPGFIQAKLFLPKKGNVLENASKRKLVQIHMSDKGTAIILPGGFCKNTLDIQVRRRNFPTRAPLLPSERVARTSKHTIREIIQRSLEHLHFVRQLPFLALFPF